MYYIGVDVGGMSIKCGLVNESGEIVERAKSKPPVFNEEATADAISVVVGEVLRKSGVKKFEVVGVGVGVPGVVDSDGIVRYATNLSHEIFPLKKMLESRLGLKVLLANDADCAALGEASVGGAKGVSDVVMVTVGTGVGGGIIMGGKLFSGAKGIGGEIGHMRFGGNELCGCGRRGCLETVVSATALIRRTDEYIAKYPESVMAKIKEQDGEVNGMTVFKAMAQGDDKASQLYGEYIRDLGDVLVNLANVFRPSVVLIGGGISAEGEKLRAPLQEHMDANVYGGEKVGKVSVKCASLGNDAGIIGSAFLLK